MQTWKDSCEMVLASPSVSQTHGLASNFNACEATSVIGQGRAFYKHKISECYCTIEETADKWVSK